MIVPRVIMESTQPTGHTKYRNVRFGYSGKIQYTHTNRSKHIYTSVVMVAAIGLPIPRRASPKV